MGALLITGGAGFIGSKIAAGLVNAGHAVKSLDRVPCPVAGVKSVRGSVLEPHAVKRALSGCDCVLHLAAALGVRDAERDPLNVLRTNIGGTETVLDCCRSAGNVKKILFSSSSEVYGEPESVPIGEAGALRPKSVYGLTKIVGEEYVKAFSGKYGLTFTIIRYFNVYGPGQRPDFVIPAFARNAVLGAPLVVNGSGRQVRAFTYVEDAVEATVAALFSKNADKETFNIGNPAEPVSMNDLAKTVVRLSGGKSKIVHIPIEKTERRGKREIYKRVPDISKARRVLGYRPRVGLSAGIKNVIKYWKERIANENIFGT